MESSWFSTSASSPTSFFGSRLAGRALTLPAFVGTLVSSWYGGILGVGEYGYRYGISNWLVFGVPYYVAALLFAFLVARRARQSPYVSIPDALRQNYGEAAARIGGLIVFLMTAPAAYVLMLGTLFGFVFGIPASVGIIAGAVLSLAYVVRGGLRAVVRTDLFQFALMFGAFLVAAVFLVGTHGLKPILNDVPSTHWTWHGGNSAQYVLVWFFIALATLVEPAFYQRVFAAESPATARKGIIISVGFWIVFDCLSTTTALYARALLPAGTDPVLAFPQLASEAFPGWLAALFFIGMLATIMSTVDTNGFIAAATLSNLITRERQEMSEHAAARARWGILGVGIWAAGLALISESIVDLWHDLGSIGTPALLLPMLGCIFPRLRIRRSWIAVWILAPGAVAAVWLFVGSSAGYPLGLEPIYVGLLTSVIIRLCGRGG
jgi:SSS family solute:Na+ symporter